jgi:hypothetical protein
VYTESADSVDIVRFFIIVVLFDCRSSCCCSSWPPISDASANKGRDDNKDPPPSTAFISEKESTFDLVFIESVLDLAAQESGLDLLESVLALESGSGGVAGTIPVHPADEENLDILLAIEYREYR